MKRIGLSALAVCLILAALGGAFAYVLSLPTTLRVAVSTLQPDDVKMMHTFGQLLGRGRESVRLRVVPVENAAAAAAKLDKGEVDLAVLRSDVAMPASAQTLAILHRNAAVIVTTPSSQIRSVGQLVGRTLGVVRGTPPNLRLFDTILGQYEILSDSVRRVPLEMREVEQALRSGRVDAVLAVGPLLGPVVGETVSIVSDLSGGLAPVFIPIGEADAIAERMNQVEAVEVLRGLFGGTPPKPMEKVTTLGFTHRLAATEQLSDTLAGEVTRLLFALKPALTQEVALASGIEAPSTEKGEGLPVHAGAAAYIDGEQQTFFDRYGDYLYLGIIGLSMLGSGFAALLSRSQARDRARIDALTQRLTVIMRAARGAEDAARLDDYQQEIDDLFGVALAAATDGTMDDSGIAAFGLALEEARRAVSERRAALERWQARIEENGAVHAIPLAMAVAPRPAAE